MRPRSPGHGTFVLGRRRLGDARRRGRGGRGRRRPGAGCVRLHGEPQQSMADRAVPCQMAIARGCRQMGPQQRPGLVPYRSRHSAYLPGPTSSSVSTGGACRRQYSGAQTGYAPHSEGADVDRGATRVCRGRGRRAAARRTEGSGAARTVSRYGPYGRGLTGCAVPEGRPRGRCGPLRTAVRPASGEDAGRRNAVLTGFEPAASTLTGWRALQTAPQDLAFRFPLAAGCEARLYSRSGGAVELGTGGPDSYGAAASTAFTMRLSETGYAVPRACAK